MSPARGSAAGAPAPSRGGRRTGDGGATGDDAVPVWWVKGEDPSLVAQEAHRLVASLVGDDDPGLCVEEFGGPAVDQIDVGAVVDACTTPPFLVARRVVVVRDAGRLTASDAGRLAAYLEDPLPTTSLVLVAGGGTVPAALSKVVGRRGEVRDTSVGTGKARTQWLAEHVRAGPVRLDGAAQARLADHLGEDVGRLAGLLDALAAAYGPGATVGVDDLEPFLGAAGSLAPWDLTDAVDAGDMVKALTALHRMLEGSGSHPLVVLAILHRHYRQLLRLDGSGATSPEQAAELLGLRSAFPARKALGQSRRLGSARIGRAIRLLAGADLALRGASALPEEATLEVLVARLSRLAREGSVVH
ncbi:MAG: DNA polymerase III subunit delta [Acidimicrobiales bacterium]|nr:DNA polymerase III subunit delta [Acidimicrobiales bacterium]